ncbi:MAG: radical SAM protein [Desulfovibrionaceae bacterium]|nr:radical SAM protein [Desulfovibrionaceae bacterium]
MKNIYLVQPDAIRAKKEIRSAYLPYAVGQLWAYARADERIARAYRVKKFIFLFEPISALVDEMEDPFLVGFSAYTWNTEYCKALAQAVKTKFPDCRILFGGHNVPPDDSFLTQFPYINYLIHSEGEISFHRLLLELLADSPNYVAVPGLHYRFPDGSLAKNQPKALAGLETVPSPYLTGVFDEILVRYPDIRWSVVFETNRGCPYKCAYCDWGNHVGKMRLFPISRVLGEIAWFGANKIEYMFFADANFGILDRDERIADAIIKQSREIGYPMVTEIIYAKENHERVQRIVKKVSDAGLGYAGARISLQSLSPVVLKNIHRSNLDFSYYKGIFQSYRKACLPHVSDLILGLPGETFQSFCEGIGKLLEMGQHEGVLVFPLALLPNSPLAQPELQRRFSLQTARSTLQILSQSLATDGFENIPEYIDYVVSTDTMPEEDMLSAYLFANLVIGSHSFALTWYIAMYLHEAARLPYEKIYCALLDFAHVNPDTLLSGALEKIKSNRLDIQAGRLGTALTLPYEKSKVLSESVFLFGMCVHELERFFRETAPFFSAFFDDKEVFGELLRYQFESLRQPGAPGKTSGFRYDFPAYFKDLLDGCPSPLQQRDVRLAFADDRNPADWKTFAAEVVFRGARENRSLYTVSYIEDPDDATEEK